MTEYLYENPNVQAKTLFATHYHELNALADMYERIKNYRVEVREYEDKVIFLRRSTKEPRSQLRNTGSANGRPAGCSYTAGKRDTQYS